MTPASREELLEQYTDSELAQYIIASPLSPFSTRVFDVSTNLIAKYYEPPEVEDAVKASEIAIQLGIRSHRIRRIVQNNESVYIIMDRIEGTILDVAWKQLGWFTTVKLGLQLRRFVKILRSVTSPSIESLATDECRSFWLEDRYPLPVHSGPAEIAHFFRFWTHFTTPRRAIEASKQPQGTDLLDGTKGLPMSNEPFVLTHHDVAPRNLVVSPTGQLSLLDWDLTGFYPIAFEYASMYNLHIPEDWGWLTRLRWHLFVWMSVGYHEADARLLRGMRSKFTRFYNGRRFELLKKGGPSKYPVT